MIYRTMTPVLIALSCSLPAMSAPPAMSPVVKNFGPVFESPADAYSLLPDTHYKVRLDVSATTAAGEQRNRSFEAAARFLNMHAARGIDAANMEFALIVHGAATRDLLSDEAYRTRYGEENPNTALLQALGQAGVKMYLCAQSAAHGKFAWQDFNPAVTIAVSAMTAHVRLESEGFTVIPF